MKVVIENVIASCRLSGEIDLVKIARHIDGARYQPSVFEGIMFTNSDPKADVFILGDGTMKFHGLTSEEKLMDLMGSLVSMMREKGLNVKVSEPLNVKEVVASFSLGSRIDPKRVYEEFKEDGVLYDPSELPGFILPVGTSGIEVLIFPEGTVISKGAKNIPDAVSSLQMVETRINKGR
ncbi:MAG: hypothetical protein JXA22_05935 [Candidatus Thermoplasmatota archaeon]|nr:hypothetical protein [Candidatus Thermoplasmatota archaeon]